jgi:anaerobic selenocysteine-containing dehydrogenase
MTETGVESKKTFCRICTAYCGLEIDLREGRIDGVRGDRNDAMSGGYTCIKGRQLDHQLAGPARLRGSLKRSSDGSFESISSRDAIDEVGGKLADILAQYGPRAIATYSGTAAYSNSGLVQLVRAWQRGFGSISNYSTLTIDQPSKIIAVARQGVWAAGAHGFTEADVIMTIGNNPIVSGLSLPGGPPGTNPVKSFEDARRRGLKVICIDPRRSETARRSDLHLQIRPGEDATVISGILHVILEENLHDADFCRDHAAHLSELKASLRRFTPDYVEARADIPSELLITAARLFAAGPKGSASSGTGPDMGPHPSLTQQLISNLNAICGRYHREGEAIPNPGVIVPDMPRPAQVIAPALLPPGLKFGEARSRFRNLPQMFEEMPTTTLAEEILEPGEEQIRALITVGGNPAVAVPDAAKMVCALESLDLLVSIDIGLTDTAKRADYVLAARHSLEREDLTDFMDMFYEVPYAHYTNAVLEPDFDVINDWDPFVAWADRLGGKIELPGGEVPLDRPLSKLELLKRVYPAPRVPLEELRAHSGGRIWDQVEADAAAPIPGLEARFELLPEGIAEELETLRDEDFMSSRGDKYTHLLICRRMKMVHNTTCHDFPLSQNKTTTNSAFMNDGDVEALGLEDGDLVEIESDTSTVLGVVSATDEVKPGVVSMAHGWGKADGDGDVRKNGANTSRLMSPERDYDPVSGMARMTAIPVAIRPALASP